jgi:lysozyme
MERSIKIFPDGRVVELEDDLPVKTTDTNGQVQELINALTFTQAEIFTIADPTTDPSEEVAEPRGGAPSPRKINQAGLDLIKHFEDVRLTAYQDSVGVWTIGYGHTGNVLAGMQITAEQAEQLLQDDLERFEAAVEDAVKVSIDDNQFSALVSFAFNLGPRSLVQSTLLKLLHQGDVQGAADQFLVWNRAGGQVLPGLTRRRNAERALFSGKSWKAFSDVSATTVRTLKLTEPRMQGEDVRQIQAALAKAGFNIEPDGVFGSNTDQAIRAFQQKQGLTADGIVGGKTREQLSL